MESFKNKRRIQQGEDWNLDILLSQSEAEYIPYIIGKRENPYFVVTVASTKFEKINRYKKSWWLSVTDTLKIPTFNQTVPHLLPDQEALITTVEQLRTALSLMEGEVIEPFDALYQYKYNGKTYFIYYNGTAIKDDYECRITCTVSTTFDETGKYVAGTGDWSSQNYMYQITLVSGETMHNVLVNCRKENPNLQWPVDMEHFEAWIEKNRKEAFLFVKNRLPNYFQEDITYDSPLGRIWVPVPILVPTELSVNNNLGNIM